jgi:hypothetical protein
MKTEDLINKVVDSFDADQASKMYRAVGWKWAGQPGGGDMDSMDNIPAASDLRREGRRLLETLMDTTDPIWEGQLGRDHRYITCGGLVASLTTYADRRFLRLEFVGAAAETHWEI